MKTVILCGGLGTRLSEETQLRPNKNTLEHLWNEDKAPWKVWAERQHV